MRWRQVTEQSLGGLPPSHRQCCISEGRCKEPTTPGRTHEESVRLSRQPEERFIRQRAVSSNVAEKPISPYVRCNYLISVDVTNRMRNVFKTGSLSHSDTLPRAACAPQFPRFPEEIPVLLHLSRTVAFRPMNMLLLSGSLKSLPSWKAEYYCMGARSPGCCFWKPARAASSAGNVRRKVTTCDICVYPS